MPISYTVDSDRRVIFTRWEGVVTKDDLATHWKRLFSDERALAIRRSLTDLRGAVLQFSGEDVRWLTAEKIRPLLEKGPWKTAMVIGEPAIYGVGRQFQTYTEMFSSSAIFPDESAALEWLLAE